VLWSLIDQFIYLFFFLSKKQTPLDVLKKREWKIIVNLNEEQVERLYLSMVKTIQGGAQSLTIHNRHALWGMYISCWLIPLCVCVWLGFMRRYQPKTKQTRAAYEQLLSKLAQYLGDVPQDVLSGATDESLAILKNDRLKVFHSLSLFSLYPFCCLCLIQK
jgi:hypothetical protein